MSVGERIRELMAVAEKATPHEWTFEEGSFNHGYGLFEQLGSVVSTDGWHLATIEGCVNQRERYDGGLEESRANAAHIATFDPPTVLALLRVAYCAEYIRRHGKGYKDLDDALDALAATGDGEEEADDGRG